jgi:hypothetical protein
MNNYNNYGIFRWNNDNCLYTNSDNKYNDVYLHTGSIIKGQWENSLCVTRCKDNLKVISNSNHFLHGHEWDQGYNHTYRIYDNLVRNYLEITNVQPENVNTTLNDKDIYFSMLDAFSFSNSGHNLSVMLDAIQYILNNNIKNILIFKNYKNTHNFKFIDILLPNCNFIELDENTIYKIKNVIIIYPEFYNIWKHPNLINELKTKILDKYHEMYNECKFKKIILMKTNRNKNVMLEHNRINCEKLLCMLEQNDYINIIPEEINCFQLCIYLMFAKTILFSNKGSVIYTNKIFINTSNLFTININNIPVCDSYGLKNINVLICKNTYNITNDESIEFCKQLLNI